MVTQMVILYYGKWEYEYKPKWWGEQLVVKPFQERNKANPGNFRGMTLLSTVGKYLVRF